MSERNPFDQKPAVAGGGPLRCEEWEVLLADALDGQLPAKERAAFDAHGASCAVCAQLLTQAQQGREWLQFLGAEPEIPSDMVERILGKTSGAAASPLALGSGAVPIAAPAHVLGVPVRRVMWDSRMMMTAAMAFFSIALTLNLAGVRLTNLKLSDLTPASMEMNLTRQFYGAQKSLVQYYDNLRFVYEVESKMRELRRVEQMQQPPQTEQQQVPANPPGNGHKNGGRLEPAPKIPQEGLLWGTPTVASEAGLRDEFEKAEQDLKRIEEEAEIATPIDGLSCDRVVGKRDQAERGLA
jgi:Putative zinc-finger